MTSDYVRRFANLTAANVVGQLVLVAVATLYVALNYDALVSVLVPLFWLLGATYRSGRERRRVEAGEVSVFVEHFRDQADDEACVDYAETVSEYLLEDVDDATIHDHSTLARTTAGSVEKERSTETD